MLRRAPADLRRQLVQVAAEQAGYFTAEQARLAGYSYAAQRYHVARGTWTRIDRAIFRLPEWPRSPHEDLVRWTLWSRQRGVVSHASGLALHELGDVIPTRVHLTVPPGFRSRSQAVTLHFAELSGADVESREGYRVTTPLRTILDVAATGLERDQLQRVIQDAFDRGVVARAQLVARARAAGPRALDAIDAALAAGRI